MNNLYKSIKLMALFVALIGLSACQKDKFDVLAFDEELAQDRLPGFYVFPEVDTVAMNLTLHEWKLEDSKTDGKVGYYLTNSFAKPQTEDVKIGLTWQEGKMRDDYLSLGIPVTMDGGVEKELTWANGVVETDGYVTNKFAISISDVLDTLRENFKNLNFTVDDTVWVNEVVRDTLNFLNWKSDGNKTLTKDSFDNYVAFLEANKDTIEWFNRERHGNVRLNYKQLTDSTYKVTVFVCFPDRDIQKITRHLGPSRIVNGQMAFNLVAGEYKGSYTYRIQTWSDDCYYAPEETTAVVKDSLFSMPDMKWTFCNFVNFKKFTILMNGDEQIKVTTTKGQGAPVTKEVTAAAAYRSVDLTEYKRNVKDKKDPSILYVVATANEIQYKHVIQ